MFWLSRWISRLNAAFAGKSSSKMFSEVADDNMFDKPGEVWKAADGTGSSYVS